MAQLPRVGDLFGRYRIDDRIGFGGIGVVYGATDLDLGRRVAVKVLSTELGGSAEFLQRFQREAALLARLASPHVIGVYDYGEHDGSPYIVTQFVGGGDLGDLLRARGPMPPALALDVCAQIADALADTHRLGVIHRDVKPSNVLLRDPDTATLTAYLCDFGIARTSADGLTSAGTVSGTWAYLAPEVAMGGPATPRSDIYALGCLLWAALTGRPPYAGSDVEMALAHQRAPVPQLGMDMPFTARVDEILRRCLAKDPAERYADADSVRTALLAAATDPAAPSAPLLTATPDTGPGLTRSSGHGRTPRRRRVTAIVATSTAAVLVAAGVIVGITRPWDGGSALHAGGTRSAPAASSSASAPAHRGPVLGDLDGDGHGDVVVAEASWGSSADQEAIYHSTGKSLGAARIPANAYDRYLADVDGDGRADLLDIGYSAETKRSSMEVDGHPSGGGKFVAFFRYTRSDHAFVHVLGVADIDGDAKAEVLSYHVPAVHGTDDFHGALTFYAQSGADSRTAGRHRIAQVDLGSDALLTDVTAGDVNGDGRADLVVAETPNTDDRVRTTIVLAGKDGFGKPKTTTYRFGELTPVGVHVGDVDDDGRAEIVYLLSNTVTCAVQVADYRGTLRRPQNWGVVPDTQTGDAGLSDVNGDGRADLVLAYWKGAASKPDQGLVQVALAAPDQQFRNATTWGRIPGQFPNTVPLDVLSATEWP